MLPVTKYPWIEKKEYTDIGQKGLRCDAMRGARAAHDPGGGAPAGESHRIASQPLLSDVSVEKDKDELGEKDSALPQTSGYCASQPARVLKHAEKITALGVRTHSAFERLQKQQRRPDQILKKSVRNARSSNK